MPLRQGVEMNKSKNKNTMLPEKTNLDKCIACSSCVICCPVSSATSKFLGPKLTGPALQRFRLMDLPETEWLEYCSNCKNCDITCPFGVSVSLLNMTARGEYCKKHIPKIRDWVLGHGRLLSKLVSIFPHFLVKFLMLNKLSRLMLDFIGIDKRAPLPVFAKKYFSKGFKQILQAPSIKKVVFYPGCYVDVYDPQTGFDIVDILNRAGYEVIVPKKFDCCGLPLIANGFISDAHKSAEINYKALSKYTKMNIPILASCPSCILTLRKDYSEMFPDIVDNNPLDVQDVCEFILKLIDSGELKNNFSALTSNNIVYHEPCHLKVQGAGKPGYRLLKLINGLNVTDANAGCCGISGSYGFKKGKYEIGMSVGKELFRSIKSNNADVAASECGTCRVQIKHGTGIDVLHPVSVLKKYFII